MEYDNDLFKAILQALEKVEPDTVEHHTKILPDYEDQEKVRKHVLQCKNYGWIDFKDRSTRRGFCYMFVKIIEPGKEYLKKLDKAHIILHMLFPKEEGGERGVIHLISISPDKIKEELRFGIVGEEEQYSFDKLSKEVKKRIFKRGQTLNLFFVNQETGQKQDFGLDISKGWPDSFVGIGYIQIPKVYEITSVLKKIGVL